MSRDITVTFSDGSQHVYKGAPDGTTPDQAIARANKDFPGKTITNVDGGRKPASDQTSVPPSNAGARVDDWHGFNSQLGQMSIPLAGIATFFAIILIVVSIIQGLRKTTDKKTGFQRLAIAILVPYEAFCLYHGFTSPDDWNAVLVWGAIFPIGIGAIVWVFLWVYRGFKASA